MRQVEFRMKNGNIHRAIVEPEMVYDLHESWSQARHNMHDTVCQSSAQFPMYLVTGYIVLHDDEEARQGSMQVDLSDVECLVDLDDDLS